MKYRLVCLLSFIAVVSFVFYACGDEDSSSTSLAPTTAQTKAAANNDPTSGSVIQGSRADSDGVTDDLVTDDGDGSVSVEGVDSAAFEQSGISSVSSIVSGFYSYTDSVGDAWGMFVDGEETESESFPTSDTCYSGDAVVYYDATDTDGNAFPPRRLEGDVTLTFDQAGNSISGSITNIPSGRSTPVTVILEGASPDADTNLYSGNTELQNVPGAVGQATGKWGVQFFSDGDAVVLAGTWGGTISADLDDPNNVDDIESSSAVGVLVVSPTDCPSN